MTMAKAEWKPHRLDELGFVGRGKSRHRPRNDSRLYGGSYPFIQTADVMAADPYITSYSQTYTEFGLQQSKLWPPNTLCMTIAGANTAKTAILKFKACFPDSVVGFIPDEKKSDLCFVKYSLDLMKERFLSITRGATQDNLSLDKLLSFSIPTPPLTVQRRIASILSAYDDLIENNLRRITILEEMARALYEEWFIKFRFPGYEKGRVVDSSLGSIPEGWHVANLGELADFVKGIEPGSKHYRGEYREGMVPFLRVGDLGKRESTIFVSKEIVKGRVLNPEDIAVTMDGTVGLVRMGLEGAYSSGIRRVVSRDQKCVGWAFMYQLLQSESIQNVIEAHAKGTTIKHASSAINHMLFALPDPELMSEFENRVVPMYQQILSLMKKNATLRRTHDLLLPKLMSGELDVSQIEVNVPAEVA